MDNLEDSDLKTRFFARHVVCIAGARGLIQGSMVVFALVLLAVFGIVSASERSVPGTARLSRAVAVPVADKKPRFEVTGFQQGMLALYGDNRRNGIPNLITPDLLLLAYSQIRQQRIEQLEQQLIKPALKQLLHALHSDIATALQESTGNVVSFDVTAVSANYQFVGLLLSLLGDPLVPQRAIDLAPETRAEQQLVLAANGISLSPVRGVKTDYSQFQPRGRYSASVEMERYFRTVRYANSVLFAFRPSLATGVSLERALQNARQAADLVTRLQKPAVQPHYRAINMALEWQFGKADDMTASDVAQVLKLRNCDSGDSACQAMLAEALTAYAVERGRTPQIIGAVVNADRLEDESTAQDALTGWRLLASRYSADNAAMQQLLYTGGDELLLDCSACVSPPPNSSAVNGRTVKGYPSMLEVMALLGSRKAADQLDQLQMRAYSNYPNRASAAAAVLQRAGNLESAQLAVIRSLLMDEQHLDSPSIQRPNHTAGATDTAFDPLAAASGFWIWQKYLNLLYQKQPYTVTGRNLQLSPSSERPGAWISGPVQAYQSLLALVEQHRQYDVDPAWDEFSGLLARCLEIRKHLQAGGKLDNRDNQFLNRIDRSLNAIGVQNDEPVIADIHTNAADSQVLEVATLYPRVISRNAARGAGFQVNEFKVSLDKRLTVEHWRRVLSTLAR